MAGAAGTFGLRRAGLAIAALALLGGCGWRTGLDEGLAPLDAGAPPPDGASDVVSDVPAPTWALGCPEEELVVPAREPHAISVGVPEDVQIDGFRWTVPEAPEGSTARPIPRRANPTTFTPDLAGSYVLELSAVDSEGGVQRCEVHLVALPGPPVAVCPGPREVAPLEVVRLEGDGWGDRPVTSYHWEVIRRPDGSASRQPSPQDARVTEFQPDVAGEYTLRLTVTDEAGETGTCEVLLLALSTQGLRVEIFWNGPPDRSCSTWTGPPPCDDTDVDVHLLRPGSEFWFHATGDCFFANCTGRRLSWGSPGPEDDPRLDIDVVDGFGPENINIDEPYAGTYRVGVDFWDGHSGSSADVTVNIYCGGDPVEPDVTFGPVTLLDRGGSRDQYYNDFWIVADVEIRDGAPCRVIDLSLPDGQPRLIPHGTAGSTR